jgi:short subunit dehydrogenase-like uncharacterized protein
MTKGYGARMTEWMIYGANGYTGELIAREAVNRGLKPVLAGRSPEKIASLGAELGLSFRVFDLTKPDLTGFGLVLHCAGPFSATAKPMIEACLAHKAHYLDITGEIAVFELAHSLHQQALDKGIVICPGVGFDVIPTDCVAAQLKERLPDATHLALGFDTRSPMSPGTSKTSVESLGAGGKVRRDGKIVTIPMGSLSRQIDFGAGVKWAPAIPWGDVATSFYTTGIPNVEVYVATSPKVKRGLTIVNLLRPILKLTVMQNIMKSRVPSKGPSEQKREQTPVYVWGEARNAKGDTVTMRLKTANGYDITVTGSLAMTEHVLRNSSKKGYFTPSQLCGADLVNRLPGTTVLD